MIGGGLLMDSFTSLFTIYIRARDEKGLGEMRTGCEVLSFLLVKRTHNIIYSEALSR